MTRIWERLYIGGIEDAEALADSNPRGITTVISLCREQVRARTGATNYLQFPVPESGPLPLATLDVVIDALWENIRWGTVLLHTRGGTNRVPILAAAWMNAVGYESIDTALSEIGKQRTIAINRPLLSSVNWALK